MADEIFEFELDGADGGAAVPEPKLRQRIESHAGAVSVVTRWPLNGPPVLCMRYIRTFCFICALLRADAVVLATPSTAQDDVAPVAASTGGALVCYTNLIHESYIISLISEFSASWWDVWWLERWALFH